MITPSHRLESIVPQFFAALDEKLVALRAAGKDAIRLDVGSPDLPPAPHILETLYRSAAQPDRHGYQPHKATPAYRLAWGSMYQRLYGVKLDTDREIVPLLGSKEGIFHLMLALIDPSDVVLIPDPGYITYTQGTLIAGGEPFFLPINPENGFLPDLGNIPSEILRRTKVLWLNYPNNPTAATASLEYFAEVVRFAREHHFLVCHDAAYSQVSFEGRSTPSILQLPGAHEVAIEFNTLSKSHNMAGWRLCAALGNPQALRALFTLKTHADSGYFLPLLEAATAAMTGDQEWLSARNEIYRQRRDLVIEALAELGVNVPPPSASLYIWCPIPAGWQAVEFTETILEKALVSFAPGTIFGQNGEGYVRISLTTPSERLRTAMQRLLDNRDVWMPKALNHEPRRGSIR